MFRINNVNRTLHDAIESVSEYRKRKSQVASSLDIKIRRDMDSNMESLRISILVF